MLPLFSFLKESVKNLYLLLKCLEVNVMCFKILYENIFISFILVVS